MNANTSAGTTASGALAHDREEHLQVVARGEHRVRATPPAKKLQVVILYRAAR